jgi:hypothetical protein
MSIPKNIKVTSHVGRDLLASAAIFKTEASATWEYIVNSLQYVDDGVTPKVHVDVKPRLKQIEISDNGRGMTEKDLNHFFTMHAENIERLRGLPGRGKFGTGKSAAFGIGNLLRVDTQRNGYRNVVELNRDAIVKSGGKDIDVKVLIQNEQTNLPNGTTITIGEIFLEKINIQPIVEYVERHLQVFRARMPEVAINEHVCQYREPTIFDVFNFHPDKNQSKMIGDVELTIKVSSSPLPVSEQGISISAGLGNLVAIETAGIERKEMGNYLFGDIDVPALETFKSPIEPYDLTRSLQLNPNHPVVKVLIPFIGSKLEEVRKEQVKKLYEARKTEEARRLANEAQKISEILNKDFENLLGRLQAIRTALAKPGRLTSNFGQSGSADNEEGIWVEGISFPGDIEKSSGNKETERVTSGLPNPEIVSRGIRKNNGTSSVDPAGGEGKKRKKPRGGFNVEYRHLGEENDRSKYDQSTLTILINLDNAVVRNALKSSSGVEDISFRRLSYEIAFTEYAMALGYELLEQDRDMPADDLIYEVRTTLNRVSTGAAFLYM